MSAPVAAPPAAATTPLAQLQNAGDGGARPPSSSGRKDGSGRVTQKRAFDLMMKSPHDGMDVATPAKEDDPALATALHAAAAARRDRRAGAARAGTGRAPRARAFGGLHIMKLPSPAPGPSPGAPYEDNAAATWAGDGDEAAEARALPAAADDALPPGSAVRRRVDAARAALRAVAPDSADRYGALRAPTGLTPGGGAGAARGGRGGFGDGDADTVRRLLGDAGASDDDGDDTSGRDTPPGAARAARPPQPRSRLARASGDGATPARRPSPYYAAGAAAFAFDEGHGLSPADGAGWGGDDGWGDDGAGWSPGDAGAGAAGPSHRPPSSARRGGGAGATPTPPAPKPRVERNRHVRLKRALAGRASLAGDGTRTVAPATGAPTPAGGAGVRRSARAKHRPLEWWRCERKVYGREHRSLPTVAAVVTRTPSPSWEYVEGGRGRGGGGGGAHAAPRTAGRPSARKAAGAAPARRATLAAASPQSPRPAAHSGAAAAAAIEAAAAAAEAEVAAAEAEAAEAEAAAAAALEAAAPEAYGGAHALAHDDVVMRDDDASPSHAAATAAAADLGLHDDDDSRPGGGSTAAAPSAEWGAAPAGADDGGSVGADAGGGGPASASVPFEPMERDEEGDERREEEGEGDAGAAANADVAPADDDAPPAPPADDDAPPPPPPPPGSPPAE